MVNKVNKVNRVNKICYEVHWLGNEYNKEKEEWERVEKVHGAYDTYDEAYNSILNWWKIHNFKPHYIRLWTVQGDSEDKKSNIIERTIIDYGFHTMFYHIVKRNA